MMREMAQMTSLRVPPAEWGQIFAQANRGLTKALADTILALDFSEDEIARVDTLSEKSSEGNLSRVESAELEAHAEADLRLAHWRLRARDFLDSLHE